MQFDGTPRITAEKRLNRDVVEALTAKSNITPDAVSTGYLRRRPRPHQTGTCDNRSPVCDHGVADRSRRQRRTVELDDLT